MRGVESDDRNCSDARSLDDADDDDDAADAGKDKDNEGLADALLMILLPAAAASIESTDWRRVEPLLFLRTS